MSLMFDHCFLLISSCLINFQILLDMPRMLLFINTCLQHKMNSWMLFYPFYSLYHSSSLCYCLLGFSYDYKFYSHYGIAILCTVIVFIAQKNHSLAQKYSMTHCLLTKTKSYTLGFKTLSHFPLGLIAHLNKLLVTSLYLMTTE